MRPSSTSASSAAAGQLRPAGSVVRAGRLTSASWVHGRWPCRAPRTMRRADALARAHAAPLVRTVVTWSQPVPGQPGPAAEEGQLQQHGDAGHLGAQPAHQLGGRDRGAAGGQHVVDDQDPGPGRQRVGVQGQRSPRRTRGRRRPRRWPAAACPACAPARSRRPSASATGGPKRKPRASSADDGVDAAGGTRRPARATAAARPSAEASSGVTSLNVTPGRGKSGTSTTRDARSTTGRPSAPALAARLVLRLRPLGRTLADRPDTGTVPAAAPGHGAEPGVAGARPVGRRPRPVAVDVLRGAAASGRPPCSRRLATRAASFCISGLRSLIWASSGVAMKIEE